MCDYSLCGLPNRLAIEGETLVATRFSTGTTGFAPHFEPNVAPQGIIARFRAFANRIIDRGIAWEAGTTERVICMPPGSRLVLSEIPAWLCYRVNISREERVTFVQIDAEPNHHRDAVQFIDGRLLLIADMPIGIRAQVLSLSCHEDGREELREAAAEEFSSFL